MRALPAVAIGVAWATAALLVRCGPPEPRSVLDHEALLERFDWSDNRDWDWYEANIPFFESPDEAIDATYYYRWELLTKHLVYGSPESGYTLTEFIDRPYWSGRYGSISCPLGHQAYELRWLKDPRVIEDFARYWFETPGAQPRRYSNWYGDAMWATYAVLGDRNLLRTVYPYMEAQVEGWTDEHWDPEHRMYRWVGAWDGMETNINSRLTDDTFSGAEGYRPTLNSYLYGDLRALARTAALFGEEEKARAFAQRAVALKERVEEELWDPERSFFFHQFAFDEKGGIEAGSLTYETGPYAGNPHGRELLGYVPWQFDLPDPGYEGAWKFLMDPDYFWAPFGPTGVEQGDPQFLVSTTCCVWSGNAWPYATTQTLVAMANLLNDYVQTVVDRDDYFRLLRTYALGQRMEGRPYVAEAADPFTGSWAGHNSFYHSEHYFHSGFIDLVVTGLVGLRPTAGDSVVIHPLAPEAWEYFALEGVAYHGHDLTILWDRSGGRYGRGAGLAVFLDGREIARGPGLAELRVPIPPPPSSGRVEGSRRRLVNYAVNNDGTPYPLATASSSEPTSPPFYAVDGNRWYHPLPPNRWIAGNGVEGSGPAWFEVNFGVARPLTQVKLYFLDQENGPAREATGEVDDSGYPGSAGSPPVLPPSSYEVQRWDGSDWVSIPGQRRTPSEPAGRRANLVEFPPLETARIRVLLKPQPGATTGFTELEAWGPSEGPVKLAPAPRSGAFPRASASFTGPSDAAAEAVDGRLSFSRYSRNRWTAYGSPNAEDWLEVDLGSPERVASVDLYLYGDGRGIAAPADYRVEAWDGTSWRAISAAARTPRTPTAWALNRVTFSPVETRKVRVVFRHSRSGASGVTEVRLWPP